MPLPRRTTMPETVGAALAAMLLQAIAAKAAPTGRSHRPLPQAAPTGRSHRPLLYCPLTAIRTRQSSSKINKLD